MTRSLFLLTLLIFTTCKSDLNYNGDARILSKHLSKEEKGQLTIQFNSFEIDISNMDIYLRAFKMEEELELWAKNKSEARFQKIKSYRFCKSSGTLGPKRMEGDYQIPEGLYSIDRFNENSKYFLSLGLNYPNASDKIRGDKNKPGSDIFIHGKCLTIGCIPIEDTGIRELFFIARKAKEAGQNKIAVHIFPFKLSNRNMDKYTKNDRRNESFWNEIKPFYDEFEQRKSAIKFKVNNTGAYELLAD